MTILRWTSLAAGMMVALLAPQANAQGLQSFQRIATFPVFRNTDAETQTLSEIVAASSDGQTLLYTDGANEAIGFVDIANPADPQPAGVLAVGGSPTSVNVLGQFALVAVNTGADFVNTSGVLLVIDIPTRTLVRTIDLGGQPDSVAVSPDKRFVAVAIENERDEDLGNGEPPQAPAGFVVIVDAIAPLPILWLTRKVDLTDVATLFPEDAEPEYVSINSKNQCAVTLQENNHVAILDLPHLWLLRVIFPQILNGARIDESWSAGDVDLAQIDTNENDLIELDSGLMDVSREPDAIAWIGHTAVATANEGDLFGGSRGFSVFDTAGTVLFDSGSAFEHLVARVGHYPEDRSENKGSEPEAIATAKYGNRNYLFVGSERSSVVGVYALNGTTPTFKQVLPTGIGPEGLLPIPQRKLLVTCSEEDERDDGFRSVITIYELQPGPPTYPTIQSADRDDGTPIPWGALSALAADPTNSDIVYTGYDSFYAATRIFVTDVSTSPAVITDEIVLREDGQTVDLDLEGIAARADGGFWVASEGAGNFPTVSRTNQLFEVAADGAILSTVDLPAATNMLQRSNGFEGVASVDTDAGEFVYVCFQREWIGDPAGMVRIGRFEVATEAWTFFYYPLDPVESPLGGFVGLSEIVALGETTFAVIERDNRAGDDARIKRIYSFSVDGLTPVAEGGMFPAVTKTLVRDILPDLAAPQGAVIEKVEGLSVQSNGDVLIVTDNDGVDDSNGETQLINLGPIFAP